MADWFKFYNDHLDSAGMQYCLSEQPLTPSVWLLILSEASKNRLASLSWDESDFRLLGFSRKLNISPGIFNQCLTLLVRTGYIIIKDKTLTIPGWELLQSSYARGVDRGYYKSTNKTLASVSPVSTARGEESRVEKKRVQRVKTPSLEEVKLAVAKVGLPESDAIWFWNKCEGNGWTNGGKPIKSWSHVIAAWKAANYMPSQKHGAGNPPGYDPNQDWRKSL